MKAKKFAYLYLDFLKKNQTHLIMHFLIGTELERVGVVGPNLDCWWAGLWAPGSIGTK